MKLQNVNNQHFFANFYQNQAGFGTRPENIPVEKDLLHPNNDDVLKQLPSTKVPHLLNTRGHVSKDLIPTSKDNSSISNSSSTNNDTVDEDYFPSSEQESSNPLKLPSGPTRKHIKASESVANKGTNVPSSPPGVVQVYHPFSDEESTLYYPRRHINLHPSMKRFNAPVKPSDPSVSNQVKRRILQGNEYEFQEKTPEGEIADAANIKSKVWVDVFHPERNDCPANQRSSLYGSLPNHLLSNKEGQVDYNQVKEGRSLEQSKGVDMDEINLLVNKLKYKIPETYDQAMKTAEADKWQAATMEELKSIKDNKVYTKVKRNSVPKDALIVKSRLVFSVKQDETKEKFKVRLVAKGFTQKIGVNYVDKYAPVMRFDTLRLVLSIAGMNSWNIKQLDAKNAFLNGKLDYPVFLQPPAGIENSKEYVWKLNRSLYGLKQSPRIWYLTLSKVLVSKGYESSIVDPCLFWKRNCLILIYVDDILITGKTKNDIDQAANLLKNSFVMKDMAQPKIFLGININKLADNKGYSISMEDTISKLQQDYKISVTKRELITPLAKGFDKNEKEGNLLDDRLHSEYRSLIGSLLYLSNTVRVDITFAVSYLSRFLEAPTDYHLKGARRVVQYVIQTKKFKLIFGKKSKVLKYQDFRYFDKTDDVIIQDYPPKGKFDLTVISDSDWAGDIKDRKSQSGCIVLFNNNIISWVSRKQNCVAGSSAESEYISLSEAAKCGLNTRNILEELNMRTPFIDVVGDNQSALTLSAHNTQHKKTKHIDLKYHHIRNLVDNKSIRLNYINTKSNIADILTKFTDTTTFKELMAIIEH